MRVECIFYDIHIFGPLNLLPFQKPHLLFYGNIRADSKNVYLP